MPEYILLKLDIKYFRKQHATKSQKTLNIENDCLCFFF